MKRILLLMIGIVLISLTAQAQQNTDSRFPLFDTLSAAQHHCPFDEVVWLNKKTDTYSLNGPQPGDTKETGAYMCQRDADQMDYRPATAPAAH